MINPQQPPFKGAFLTMDSLARLNGVVARVNKAREEGLGIDNTTLAQHNEDWPEEAVEIYLVQGGRGAILRWKHIPIQVGM